MKIRLAEKSEAEAISRLVSELAVTHIGSTLQVGGLENLLRSMDVESTITRMTDGFPHWVALEGGTIVGIAVVKPPSHIYRGSPADYLVDSASAARQTTSAIRNPIHSVAYHMTRLPD